MSATELVRIPLPVSANAYVNRLLEGATGLARKIKPPGKVFTFLPSAATLSGRLERYDDGGWGAMEASLRVVANEFRDHLRDASNRLLVQALWSAPSDIHTGIYRPGEWFTEGLGVYTSIAPTDVRSLKIALARIGHASLIVASNGWGDSSPPNVGGKISAARLDVVASGVTMAAVSAYDQESFLCWSVGDQ